MEGQRSQAIGERRGVWSLTLAFLLILMLVVGVSPALGDSDGGAGATAMRATPSPAEARAHDQAAHHSQQAGQIAQRRASRSAYRGRQSRSGAASLARETFRIDRPLWQRPEAAMGADVVRHVGGFAEVIEVGKQRLLARSTVPLRIADASGALRPVSLTLVDAGRTLTPTRPLVPTSFADDASGEVSFGDGLGVAPASAGSDAPVLVGNRLVYANSGGVDLDYMAEPVPSGAEVFFQARSDRSPDPVLDFALPTGARLQMSDAPGGGAEVVRDGDVLLSVSPAAAKDADGVSVPVSMSVTGSKLSLHVDLSGDIHFPVLIDPVLSVSYGVTGGASHWSGWGAMDNPSGWFQINAYSNLLQLAADPAQHTFSGWQNAIWFVVQHGDATITRADVEGMAHDQNGATYWYGGLLNSAGSFTGTWTPSGYSGNQGAAPYTKSNVFSGETSAYCAVPVPGGADGTGTPLCDYTTGTYGFQYGLLIAGGLTVTNYARITGASIKYTDGNAPTASLSVPSGWGASLPSVTLSGSDEGLGVYGFTVNVGGQVQSQYSSCGIFCPFSDSKGYGFSSPPEGSYAATATVSDEVGNVGSTSQTVKIDRSNPTLSIAGTLWDARNTYTQAGTAALNVTASDTYSGARSLDIKVDGTSLSGYPKTQSADGGSIPSGPVTYTFPDQNPHTFLITTTDGVGRTASQTFKVGSDSAVPTISSVTHSGTVNTWTSSPGSVTSTITGQDAGSGVKTYTADVPGGSDPSTTLSCAGTPDDRCPTTSTSRSLTYNTSGYNEGITTINGTITDAVGRISSPSSWNVKIDESPPDVTTGGDVPSAPNGTLTPGNHTVSVSATDGVLSGTAAQQQSGVKTITIEDIDPSTNQPVPGHTQTVTNPPSPQTGCTGYGCPATIATCDVTDNDSCPLSTVYSLDTLDGTWSGGNHIIKVTVSDNMPSPQLPHTTTWTKTVSVGGLPNPTQGCEGGTVLASGTNSAGTFVTLMSYQSGDQTLVCMHAGNGDTINKDVVVHIDGSKALPTVDGDAGACPSPAPVDITLLGSQRIMLDTNTTSDEAWVCVQVGSVMKRVIVPTNPGAAVELASDAPPPPPPPITPWPVGPSATCTAENGNQLLFQSNFGPEAVWLAHYESAGDGKADLCLRVEGPVQIGGLLRVTTVPTGGLQPVSQPGTDWHACDGGTPIIDNTGTHEFHVKIGPTPGLGATTATVCVADGPTTGSGVTTYTVGFSGSGLPGYVTFTQDNG